MSRIVCAQILPDQLRFQPDQQVVQRPVVSPFRLDGHSRRLLILDAQVRTLLLVNLGRSDRSSLADSLWARAWRTTARDGYRLTQRVDGPRSEPDGSKIGLQEARWGAHLRSGFFATSLSVPSSQLCDA